MARSYQQPARAALEKQQPQQPAGPLWRFAWRWGRNNQFDEITRLRDEVTALRDELAVLRASGTSRS